MRCSSDTNHQVSVECGMKIVDKNNRQGDNKAMFWKLKRISDMAL
jgi:hypothetical protein